MASINLYPDYWTHRKTIRLIGRLGKGSEVLPLKLWTYAAIHHAETGRLDGYSASEIESVVQWWGKPGDAAKALVDVGFLDLIGDDYQIHNWQERAGHIIRYRQRAKASAAARWGRSRDAPRDATSNACSNACSNASSNASSNANAAHSKDTPLSPPTGGAGVALPPRRKKREQRKVDEALELLNRSGRDG